jgi:hypothetical protein
VTRKIFGPKTEEVTEDWRKLLNEEFHDFHTSPLSIKVTKSQEIKLSEHLARWGIEEKYAGF